MTNQEQMRLLNEIDEISYALRSCRGLSTVAAETIVMEPSDVMERFNLKIAMRAILNGAVEWLNGGEEDTVMREIEALAEGLMKNIDAQSDPEIRALIKRCAELPRALIDAQAA